MNVRKIVSFALCVSFAAGLLAGCGNPGAGGSASAAADGGSASGSASEKTVTVKMVSPVNGPVDKDSDLQKYLDTLVPGLAVDIEGIEIGSYWDILNPRLASGEIPDVFHVHNDTMYRNYLTQNVLYGVDPALIKEKMPKFVAASKEYGAEVWATALDNGKIYGLPAMDEMQSHSYVNCWRGDWLKAVGIEKAPETLAEYEEALTRFTFNDPDGNGVNDTYGTTMRGKDNTPVLFPSLFGAYGVFPNVWNKGEDGVLRYGITDPRAKDALTTLNAWFKKGIIDPEFTAVDLTLRTEKWANSKIGLLSDSTYYEVNPGKAAYENLKALSPDAEIVRGPAPKGPNGDYGYFNWGKFTNKPVFGKPLGENPVKLEKFLELWEMVNTDPDVYNRVKFGEEGVAWARQPDGSIAWIAPYNDAAGRGKIGNNAFDQGCLVPIPSVLAQSLASDQAEQYKYAVLGTLVNGENYFSYLGKFSDGKADTAYNMEADTVYKKNIIDFITGARPIAEYDAFVAEWNAAGGDAYTKAYNELYKNVDGILQTAKALF